ncbi:3-oxoadipate enol-lactonase [Thioclava sp. DLFJ5-1]|uniref:3-oxoadipate enol-lactonase n=1 Tax=Thioclava sp. DLFJ5-1 TaxID=1915314 RepID=UPI0009960D98|nr:3-oxoadipate enol-lactonase [Thioclava sp. DLFJ5-1]OOY20385.1 3-oxoadipate enol-lactonase [Thioclava sp. DLFJ5-1]
MHALICDWGHIHYREDGVAQGVPVICLNSLGTDLRMWDGLVAPLSGYRLVRMDKRGHGLSATSDAAPTITDLARDALAVADHLGIEAAVFVGCSIGGMIAQEIARIAPERVRALVLSNTAAKIGTEESWAERIATVETQGLPAMAQGVIERWFGPTFRAHPDCALWVTAVARTDAKGYANCCAALAGADLRDALPEISAPTLVIAGSHDGATPPEQVMEMAAAIPGARAELIEGAGHIPAIEAPEQVARLITEFLKEHERV